MKGNGEIAGIKKQQVIIISVVFSLFILTAGFIYYRYEEDRIRNEKYNELKAIAELKINQIVQWQRDRAADAVAASRSPLFIKAVQEFLNNNNNKLRFEEITSRLKLINDEYGYENILLADTSGQILVKVVSKSAHLDSFTIGKCKEAKEQQKIKFTDFYLCPLNQEIHYDIIAPVINKNQTIAVLIMRRDPHAYLFPLIQAWPTPHKTAETLLLRKEEEDVLFLNELRHLKNTALKLKIPLTEIDVPAVHAALGNVGIFNGKDYIGVKVLSYVSNIPGTPWFMVSKVNESEIFSELNYKAAIVIVLSVLSLLALWGGLAFIYNSNQKNIYRNLWQTQEEARTALYSIGDGVLITDGLGCVKKMNPVAEQLTGWKEKDAGGKPLDEVFQVIHEVTRRKIANPIHRVLKENAIVELANHALLISKDGTEIPIADSGAPIKNENGELIGTVLVFRDQTKERVKQRLIEESEQRYRGLFENMMEGFAFCKMIYKDSEPVDFIYLAVNNKFEALTGLKNAVGKRVTEIIPGIRESDSEIFDLYSNVALTGENTKIEIFVKALNTWFSVSVYSPLKEHFVAVFDVITARKQAEESLRLSEERLNRAQEIAHLGSWELDLVENKLTWTDEVYRIFGLMPQEFGATYEAFLEAIHPDDRDAVNEAYSGSIRNGKDTYEIEHRIIRKLSGEIRYVYEKCEHFRDETGKIIRSVGMVHDITERKKVEDELKLLSKQRQLALDAANLGWWQYDPISKYAWWDEKYKEIFGVSGYESPNEIILKRLHPDDLPAVWAAVEAALNPDDPKPYSVEYRISLDDGSIRWVEAHGIAEFEGFGENKLAVSFVGTVEDITDWKLAEQAVLESKAKLDAALNSMTDAVFISDVKGNFIDFNDAFAEYHKFKNKTECAKTFAEYPDILDVFMDNGQLAPVEMWAVPRALSGEKVANAEYMLRRKDTGETWWGSYSFGPIRDKNGRIVGSVVVARDITEIKNNEEALRSSELRLRRFYESNLLGVIYWNMDGKIVDANDKFLELVGYTREDLTNGNIDWINMTPQEFRYLDEISTAELKMYGFNKKPFEKEYLRKDGSRIPLLIAGAMLDEVKFNGVAFVLDISERKLLEENLSRRIEEVETLMEVAPVAIWVADDPKCNVIRGNRTANNFYEAESKENVSANISDIRRFYRNGVELKPDELPMQEAASKNVDILNSEINVLLPSGNWLYMLGSANPLRDSAGNVRGCIGAFIDVTEQKIAEEELRASEAKLLEAQKLAHMCSFVFNLEENTFDWTEEFTNIFEIDSNRKFNSITEMMEFVHPDDRSYVQSSVKNAIDEKAESLQMEYRVITGRGNIKYVNYKGKLFFNSQGQHTKRFGTIIDVTERKLYEIELKKTMEELQRSNKDLEQFAYVASHDLQEPIRMIKSYTELLRRRSFDKMNDDEKDFFGFISDGALRMHELVNALLHYSRISSRNKEFELVDCNDILKDTLKDLRMTIEETNAVIIFGELPKVKGDKILLRQLFQNLIQNAIKFKDARVPEIYIDKKSKDGFWMISVKDNGIGIPVEYHNKIFIIFQKLHTRDKYPGTGIGLAVCKKIVELHGGEICLESEVGKGTTFYFTLPV